MCKWRSWFEQLRLLSNSTLLRCFLPPGFGKVVCYQLHHLSGASAQGYGCVSYFHLVDEKGLIHSLFLCGKARVTPPKAKSIPRIELIAAVLSVKADKWLCSKLDFSECQSIFWSDSSAVRSIQNKSKRFETFVANQLAKIHRHIVLLQWRHVNSKLNIKDNASQGLSVAQLLRLR